MAKPLISSHVKDSYPSIWYSAQHVQDKDDLLKSVGPDGTERSLQSKPIQSSSKTYHLLLYDESLMSEFTENETFWDGAFDAKPRIKNLEQLFTLMGVKYGVVSAICLSHWFNQVNANITLLCYFSKF